MVWDILYRLGDDPGIRSVGTRERALAVASKLLEKGAEVLKIVDDTKMSPPLNAGQILDYHATNREPTRSA